MFNSRSMAREPRSYAGPDAVDPGRVAVGPSRRYSLAAGLFLGIIGVVVAVRAITTHSVSGLVVGLIVLGPLCVFYLRRALIGRLLVMIDANGFTDCRSGRTVEWTEVETARANTHRGAFGLDHSLCLVLKPRRHDQPTKRKFITTNATSEREIEVSLDHLSLPWEQVLDAVEANLGQRVIRTSNRGFQDARRSSRR